MNVREKKNKNTTNTMFLVWLQRGADNDSERLCLQVTHKHTQTPILTQTNTHTHTQLAICSVLQIFLPAVTCTDFVDISSFTHASEKMRLWTRHWEPEILLSRLDKTAPGDRQTHRHSDRQAGRQTDVSFLRLRTAVQG